MNVGFILSLAGGSTWKTGNIFAGMGYALGMFAFAGVLFGILVLGIYQAVRNASNPDNKFKPELEHRITASLVGGIMALLNI